MKKCYIPLIFLSTSILTESKTDMETTPLLWSWLWKKNVYKVFNTISIVKTGHIFSQCYSIQMQLCEEARYNYAQCAF